MKSSLILPAALLLLVSSLAGADVLSDARARFQDGEYEQATKLFEQSLEKSPPSAAVFYELGRALTKAGQEARAALNSAGRWYWIRDSLRQPQRQEANLALGIPPKKQTWQGRILERIPLDTLTLTGTILFWAGAFAGLAASSRRSSGDAGCLQDACC